MHILLVGEAGVGKSTLIRKLLTRVRQPVFGFRTERKADASGNARVCLRPASGENACSIRNALTQHRRFFYRLSRFKK